MIDETDEASAIAAPFKELEGPLGKTPVAPAHAVAAIALTMALKYHDIATVQDGALYQQYKLEGRNMVNLHLDMVFETAILMEAHLLGSSSRIAKLIVDAIKVKLDEEDGEHDPAKPQVDESSAK